MMRPLLIGPGEQSAICHVRKYAEAHPYKPGPAKQPPGDDPRHVIKLGTYRAVFSITHASDGIYRHLSVSVPSKKYANPAAVFMIAHHFGFTGWDEERPLMPADGWLIHVNEQEHCIVLAEAIGSHAGRAH